MKTLRCISSMATRELLQRLLQQPAVLSQGVCDLMSVGGVEAARRVRAGEPFDLVMLASDAIEALMAEGWLLPGSQVDWVQSGVAVAVRAGAPRPAIDSERALRAAVEAAPSISVSTGPSGTALLRLFERWGLGPQLADKLRTAPPGVPVGSLVARGEVALGFQQTSELISLAGIDVLGPLPPEVQVITTFSGAVGRHCQDLTQARAVLAYLASPATGDAKKALGMTPL